MVVVHNRVKLASLVLVLAMVFPNITCTMRGPAVPTGTADGTVQTKESDTLGEKTERDNVGDAPLPADPSAEDQWKKLNEQAMFLAIQGRYSEATKASEKALAFAEDAFGPDHDHTIRTLRSVARSYRIERKYTEAERVCRRLLVLAEEANGEDHRHMMVRSLSDLAGLYRTQGKYAQAGPLYGRLLALLKEGHGTDHPGLAAVLENAAGGIGEMERLDDRELCAQCHR